MSPRPSNAAKYSDTDKRDAIELATQHGQGEASRLLGIPQPTISRWCAAAGVASMRREKMRQAIESRGLAWDEAKLGLAREVGSTAIEALRGVQERLADGDMRGAQAAATTMAILVDKAQLLTGGATARSEHATTPAKVREVADQLASRRRVA